MKDETFDIYVSLLMFLFADPKIHLTFSLFYQFFFGFYVVYQHPIRDCYQRTVLNWTLSSGPTRVYNPII